MTDDISYIQNNDGDYAVPCQIKLADDCVQSGEYCDDREDARDWVEEEFWIFSGEGFICPNCNRQIFLNIAKIRVDRSR
jgi:hypothetical protein